MEYIVFGAVLVIAWFVGACYGWSLRQKVIDRRLNHALNSLTAGINANVIKVKLERHDGMLYMYELANNQFMAQGKNEAELTKVLKEKYPGKTFAASNEDIEKVGLKHDTI